MEEEKKPKKMLSSKVSIVGLFAMLTFILTIPLALMLSQQQQTIQQHAAETTLPPTIPTTVVIPNQIPGYIAGYIYKDDNQNGQRDTGEAAFPGIAVKITIIDRINPSPMPGKTATATIIKADANGYFKLPLKNIANDMHSYLIQVILPSGYKTINTNPLLLSDLSSDSQKLLGFGLFALTPISLAPSCTPRPTQCVVAGKACPFVMPKNGWCPLSPQLSTQEGHIQP